jgi:DNA-binding transcriptional LysR family regulator
MNVSLRQIRSFVAVARCGSFTLAANSLHVSQPALSVQIHELESGLGLRLFDRTSRAVNLTSSGRELVPMFKRLLDDLDTILDRVHERAAGRHEIVRVACVPSIAATVLPSLIADFRRKRPRVEVALKDVVWKRVLAMVRAEEVDLGIAPADVDEDDLIVTKLMEDMMHAVFPRRHPLAKVRTLTLDEVSRYPLVLTGKDSNVRSAIDAAFGERGEFAMPVREVAQAASAVGMVRAGFGVTILPSTSMEIRGDRALRSMPITDCVRRVSLLRKRGHPLSAGAKSLVAQLKTGFATAPASQRSIGREIRPLR